MAEPLAKKEEEEKDFAFVPVRQKEKRKRVQPQNFFCLKSLLYFPLLFIILVLLITYLPLTYSLRVFILILGVFLIEDIFHFWKFIFKNKKEK